MGRLLDSTHLERLHRLLRHWEDKIRERLGLVEGRREAVVCRCHANWVR